MTRSIRALGAVMLPLALTACRKAQSALAPQGPEADRIATLAGLLFVGAAIIFAGLLILTLVAVLAPRHMRRPLGTERLVVWGGIALPIVTLAALLAYGFVVTSAGALTPASGNPVRVSVAGELWWWRVTYTDAKGRRFASANELRIPVGRPVEIQLTSDNVIHSFWVPNLAGKLDMIPGRTTTLRLAADTPDVSRGQCGEYCGGAHALMAFWVVAVPPSEFEAWLQHASGPAKEPDTALLEQGRQLFMSSGCGACHTIRGTNARGMIGPDLTHVASRLSIGAGVLPTTEGTFARWIPHNQTIKPDNKMPPFGILREPELAALASYLASLR